MFQVGVNAYVKVAVLAVVLILTACGSSSEPRAQSSFQPNATPTNTSAQASSPSPTSLSSASPTGIASPAASPTPLPVVAMTFSEYKLPTANAGPGGITAGPDGNVWITEFFGNKVAKVTSSGAVTEYTVPTIGSEPLSITTGSDGNL